MLYALCIVNVTSYMGACMMPFLYTFQVGLLLVPLKDVEPPDTISVLAITIPLGFIFCLTNTLHYHFQSLLRFRKRSS